MVHEFFYYIKTQKEQLKFFAESESEKNVAKWKTSQT